MEPDARALLPLNAHARPSTTSTYAEDTVFQSASVRPAHCVRLSAPCRSRWAIVRVLYVEVGVRELSVWMGSDAQINRNAERYGCRSRLRRSSSEGKRGTGALAQRRSDAQTARIEREGQH